MYSQLPIIRTLKGKRKWFKLPGVQVIEGKNDLKGNVNCFELVGGSSYRGFELPGFYCIILLAPFRALKTRMARPWLYKTSRNTLMKY